VLAQVQVVDPPETAVVISNKLCESAILAECLSIVVHNASILERRITFVTLHLGIWRDCFNVLEVVKEITDEFSLEKVHIFEGFSDLRECFASALLLEEHVACQLDFGSLGTLQEVILHLCSGGQVGLLYFGVQFLNFVLFLLFVLVFEYRMNN
jgi:hypothetical protein